MPVIVGKISQEFINEQKTRIQNLITGKRELLALPQDNLTSEEVYDNSKIKGAQDITKINQDITGLENALLRIHNKVYGICIDCGNDIPTARLRSCPEATRCTDCATKHERKN